jgi:undecaprenyl pyrophosphate phosphatase UppP
MPISNYLNNNRGDVIFNTILAVVVLFLPRIWRGLRNLVTNATQSLNNPSEELVRILVILLLQVGFWALYLGVLLTISRLATQNPWGKPSNLVIAGISSYFTLAWCFLRSALKIIKIDFSKQSAN